jgi:hypothetical protein
MINNQVLWLLHLAFDTKLRGSSGGMFVTMIVTVLQVLAI